MYSLRSSPSSAEQPAQPTSTKEGDILNEPYVWNALLAAICNPYGAAGLMGNLYAESALNPKNLQQS
jgi:hypothetical protein